MRESKSRALPLGDTPTNKRVDFAPLNYFGAGDKFRTCYLQSHNLALYRLSYARHIQWCVRRGTPHAPHFGAPGETEESGEPVLVSQALLWRAWRDYSAFAPCVRKAGGRTCSRLSALFGAPGETRTPDTRLRRPLLYPAELQARKCKRIAPKPWWLERVMGIEPTQPAWKASVLPLNYTRIVCFAFATIEPGAHNSMLKNYSKYIFACQLIFVIIFLNLHFILIAVQDVFRSISIILARKFCKNALFALHIAFTYDIIQCVKAAWRKDFRKNSTARK